MVVIWLQDNFLPLLDFWVFYKFPFRADFITFILELSNF